MFLQFQWFLLEVDVLSRTYLHLCSCISNILHHHYSLYSLYRNYRCWIRLYDLSVHHYHNLLERLGLLASTDYHHQNSLSKVGEEIEC